jgi:diguanylate cyclase (GGDEF)-like protein
VSEKTQHSTNNSLSRRYDVRPITSIGFAIVIGILLISIVGGFHTTNRYNEALSEMVHGAGMKTAMAYTMREAIRERVESLQRMARTQDPFERDEEKMRFYSFAGKYVRARQTLVASLDTESEKKIFAELDETARSVGAPNARALAALFDHQSSSEQVAAAVQTAIDAHLRLLGVLDRTVRTIHQAAQDQIQATGGDFRQMLTATTLSGMVAFAIAIGIAAFVVVNASARNQQLSHHAAHDLLTGLFNRQAFEAELKLVLDQSAGSEHRHALIIFDLDRFKVVNDSCGHPAGDALLRQLSAKLNANLRSSDLLARIGGDEFGVLLRYTNAENAEEVAEKIRQTVETFEFSWDEKTFRVQASIGLVPFGHKATTTEELIGCADACCYSAKQEGRNRTHKSSSNCESARRRSGEMRWVGRISDAIDNDRFVLFGQIIKPVRHECDDGRLNLEVLLRMKDEKGLGLIAPGQFLPAAERYGLVPDIDRWVIRHALDWLKGLGSLADEVRININICGPTASDPQFHRFVRNRIAERGIPPTSLCFEITESTAISSLANASALIDALGDLGCRFALDDFGSGLSSFNQLRHLKVHYLKIEGSFIQNIDRDPINRALVESINTIGKKLGKRTVAEYVENDRILDILRDIDVDLAQGFGLHKPEPLADIERTIIATGSTRIDSDQGAA